MTGKAKRAQSKEQWTGQERAGVAQRRGRSTIGIALLALTALLALSPPVQAKEVTGYFGSANGKGPLGGEFWFTGASAVNSSGAGSANKGDVYVGDSRNGNNRIQRFALDDNGTPANPYDDSYEFISAWGADVDSTPSSGSDYEICTVAADCKAGVISGGNGTAAGNGSFDGPAGIAVDQDSGDVYVVDQSNFRVSVYSGDGAFLRSFGFDVVASGPGNTGTGYEVCVAANGDVCKKGAPGAGIGQFGGSENAENGEGIALSPPDGNPATGTVYASDHANHRVNTYKLDGASPASFGAEANFGANGPISVAVDSRGIVYTTSFISGVVARYDSQNANGGGVGFLSPIPAPPLSTTNTAEGDLQVDPDSDGAGPDTDVLYVLRTGEEAATVQQFGPLNKSGLAAPPAAVDAEHGTVASIKSPSALALGLDESSGRLFVSTFEAVKASPPTRSGVYFLDTAGGPPSATLESLSDISSTSVKVHGTVDPNGPPDVSYRIEYSTDGSNWIQGQQIPVGAQESPQPVEATLDPIPAGLMPNTLYHIRIGAVKAFTPAVVTAEKTFTTLAEAPQVETVGSPVRTTTTAQLNGRIDPLNSSSTYHFEYGAEGPCDTSPCTASAPIAAGSGNLIELASQEVEGLEPNTTYHYRIVGESAAPDSPSYGADMTFTTRASDAPLSHGHLPGPPGSDRAYEQVSIPDSGGNPVGFGLGASEDGNRALYQISGGTPISTTGNFASFYLAERSETAPHQGSWQTKFLSPPRDQILGSFWAVVSQPADLSNLAALNIGASGSEFAIWRLSPTASPQKLFEPGPQQKSPGSFVAVADESPRTLIALVGGELDPAYPAAGVVKNVYDVSSGAPELVSLLPGGAPPSCGVSEDISAELRPLSADGSRFFFGSQGNVCTGLSGLYLRELDAETTKLVSDPPLSGISCGVATIKLTADAAYFWTQSRLDPADTVPASCAGTDNGDVYRYDVEGETLKCLTCVAPGLNADVYTDRTSGGSPRQTVSVAPDGSRVYFHSPHALVRGAPTTSGDGSLYVAEAATGEVRWVAGPGVKFGETSAGNAIANDGSAIRFRAKDPSLNPLGGAADNGGIEQYYRYSDTDRSLLCVSCPQDGSAPSGAGVPSTAPVDTALSDKGDLVFATPTALVGGDQNTPGAGKDPYSGTDVYEWRDGRLLLITDGLTNWPVLGESGEGSPRVLGIDRSGRDAFFIAPTQYTPDALDGYARLYDARIGGGFEFPPPPKPCPLEVCQGTPKGAPSEQEPASANFDGLGNQPQRKTSRSCPKGKREVLRQGRARCVEPRHKKRHNRRHRRANHDRRAPR